MKNVSLNKTSENVLRKQTLNWVYSGLCKQLFSTFLKCYVDLNTVKPPYNVNFGASWKFVLYEVSCYMKVVPILYPKNSASLVLLTFWTRLRRSYSCMISFFFFKDIDCLLRFSCWTVLDEAIFRVRRKKVNFARLPELLTTFCLW